MLDDDLLSHGETPHYHRRGVISLLSSGWDQVVLTLCGRQAKLFEEEMLISTSKYGIRPPWMEEVPNNVWNVVGNLLSCILILAQHSSCMATTSMDGGSAEKCMEHFQYKSLWRYMVKPLESLVRVSSTPHNAYTPRLSTS